jgi:hypothetical protein
MISKQWIKRTWKEAAMAYFNILAAYLRKGTEENHETGYPVSWQRFETGISRIRSRSV